MGYDFARSLINFVILRGNFAADILLPFFKAKDSSKSPVPPFSAARPQKIIVKDKTRKDIVFFAAIQLDLFGK